MTATAIFTGLKLSVDLQDRQTHLLTPQTSTTYLRSEDDKPTADDDSRSRKHPRYVVADLLDLPSDDHLRELDPNVQKYLPPGCRLQAVRPYGCAHWTRTAALTVLLEDGRPASYFIKLCRTPIGLINLLGEFNSINTMNKAVPALCPVPIAVDTFASDLDVHFYLATFASMTGEVPAKYPCVRKLAELHTKATSSNGKFGFHVATNMGALVKDNKWCDLWEQFFGRLLDSQFRFEQDMCGHDQEMWSLYSRLRERVIPRLLRPLESEGRSIVPSFVHGDCWDGNMSSDTVTGEPVLFDATGFYGHFEYDLGPWSLQRHKICTDNYIDAYVKCNPPSEPVEDFPDRVRLYGLRFNLTSSSCYLEDRGYRKLAIQDMRYLTAKYADEVQQSTPMTGVEMMGNGA